MRARPCWPLPSRRRSDAPAIFRVTLEVSDLDRAEAFLKDKRVRGVVSSRSNQVRPPGFCRWLYRQRNRVERLINLLEQFRCVATRCEKRAQCYLARVVLAAVRLWLHLL